MTARRYEPPQPPVARKPAVKRVVARKPPVRRPSRRYEGDRPLPKAPVKAPSASPVTRKPPSVVATNDARHAPNPYARPGSIPPAKARAAQAAAAARRARQGAAGNDARKSSVPGSQWGRQQMFKPNVKLDASQVVDLRRPTARAANLARAVNYEAAMRAWRAKAAAVDRRRPAARVGKSRAI